MKQYYQEETLKALENFPLSKRPVDLRLVYTLVKVKQAAAKANFATKLLSQREANAIDSSCNEILEGTFDDQFVTDSLQGGAGTSLNMNVNEVIASRSTEILHDEIKILPLKHVNMSQSTNDTVPTAIKLTILDLLSLYLGALSELQLELEKKATEFKMILKVGRTHMQDAVPISLGAEFNAYASFVKRDISRLTEIKKYFYVTNMGGTAIGTAENASQEYINVVHTILSEITGYPLQAAEDLIDSTQNTDVFLHMAQLLTTSAIGLSKICTDLRCMASGPKAGFQEIVLPELQNGSSIMPGKINPVALEAMNQIAYQVSGNSRVAEHVVHAGQFELNVMLPVYAKTIIESFDLLIRGVQMITNKAIKGMQANEKRCQELLENSFAYGTALSRVVGYEKAAEIIKRARELDTSLVKEIQESDTLTDDEKKTVLNTYKGLYAK